MTTATETGAVPVERIAAAAPAARLPLFLCIGWGAGTIVTSTLLYATNTFLLRFLTDHLGIAAAMAGFLFALSKVYDAISDVAMGIISDRTNTRIGRRRPFLALGTVLAAISIWAIFAVPESFTGGALLAYVFFLMLLWTTAYTIFNIPYLAMPAEMTANPAERSHLISFRVYASGSASLLASGAGPLLLVWFGSDRAAHADMGLVFAAFILAAGLLCFFATSDAPATKRQTAYKVNFFREAKIILRDGAFMRLALVEVTRLFGITTHSVSTAFFTKYVLQASDTMLAFIVTTQTVAMILSQPFWVWFGKRFGKPAGYATGAGLYALTSLLYILVGPETPLGIIAMLSIAYGAAGGGIFLMSNSMFPDVIASSTKRTGIQNEALYVAVQSFVEKLAHGLAGFAVGSILGIFGYLGGLDPSAVTEEARFGIVIAWCIVPAIFVGGSALFLRGYRV